MDIEEIIKNNIKLFTNSKYFRIFSNILKEISLCIFKLEDCKSLSYILDNTENDLKEIKNTTNCSLWFIIMKALLYQRQNKYSKKYNIDNLSYKYLLRLCKLRNKQLLSIAIKQKKNLFFCVKIYLSLCEEKVNANKKFALSKNSLKKRRRSSLFRSLINTNRRIALIKVNIPKEEIKKLKEGNKRNSCEKKEISNINKIKNKNNGLLYCNSFTKLFIGDTDENSIIERHLSNMAVKLEQNLNINGSYIDLSGGYLKQLFNKISRQNQSQENDLKAQNSSCKKIIEIQKMFQKDYQKIENTKKRNQKNKENISKSQRTIKSNSKLFRSNISSCNPSNKFSSPSPSHSLHKKLDKNTSNDNTFEQKLKYRTIIHYNQSKNLKNKIIKRINLNSNISNSFKYLLENKINNINSSSYIKNSQYKDNSRSISSIFKGNKNACDGKYIFEKKKFIEKLRINKDISKKNLWNNSTKYESINNTSNLNRKIALKNYMNKEDFFY
jgi:hypothetical protein